MTKARRPNLRALLVSSALITLSAAQRANADPASLDVTSQCAPGAPYATCVAALESQKITLRRAGNGDWTEVSFELQPPFSGISVRTYKRAGGLIVQTAVTLLMDKGKARKDLLTWIRGQVGSAKAVRSSIAGGAAADCGAAGWGVGWVTPANVEPEVEAQLDSPESASASEVADKFKPEDALVKHQGDGLVTLCFLMPPKTAGGDFVDAPTLSPVVMRAFLSSPMFHGVAKLK